MVLGLPRTEIAEAVWPEVEPEKSRNNFHVTLNLLRKTIEPWGVSSYLSETGLRQVRVDMWELQEALGCGDVSAVIGQYDLLAPGIDLPQVVEQREHLAREVLAAVFKSVNSQNAEERLEWVLGHDPLHEEAFARLMEVWVNSGRKVTAERRYREFARRLQDELGLEPAPELRRMLLVR
jgi:DNA-binding SARP family transcriptional activator